MFYIELLSRAHLGAAGSMYDLVPGVRRVAHIKLRSQLHTGCAFDVQLVRCLIVTGNSYPNVDCFYVVSTPRRAMLNIMVSVNRVGYTCHTSCCATYMHALCVVCVSLVCIWCVHTHRAMFDICLRKLCVGRL